MSLGFSRSIEGVDFRGKKVIALGERDGIQGGVIKELAQELGAEVVFTITQCFV
jgi:betaine reductase